MVTFKFMEERDDKLKFQPFQARCFLNSLDGKSGDSVEEIKKLSLQYSVIEKTLSTGKELAFVK